MKNNSKCLERLLSENKSEVSSISIRHYEEQILEVSLNVLLRTENPCVGGSIQVTTNQSSYVEKIS